MVHILLNIMPRCQCALLRVRLRVRLRVQLRVRRRGHSIDSRAQGATGSACRGHLVPCGKGFPHALVLAAAYPMTRMSHRCDAPRGTRSVGLWGFAFAVEILKNPRVLCA